MLVNLVAQGPGTTDPDVPRIPRGRGMKLSGPHVFRILMIAGLLVMVLVMRKPCSDAVGKFVMQFDAVDAGVKGTPSKQPDPYEGKLMTEDEFRKEMNRAQDAGAR